MFIKLFIPQNNPFLTISLSHSLSRMAEHSLLVYLCGLQPFDYYICLRQSQGKKGTYFIGMNKIKTNFVQQVSVDLYFLSLFTSVWVAEVKKTLISAPKLTILKRLQPLDNGHFFFVNFNCSPKLTILQRLKPLHSAHFCQFSKSSHFSNISCFFEPFQ